LVKIVYIWLLIRNTTTTVKVGVCQQKNDWDELITLVEDMQVQINQMQEAKKHLYESTENLSSRLYGSVKWTSYSKREQGEDIYYITLY
jgi:hypothetical protein